MRAVAPIDPISIAADRTQTLVQVLAGTNHSLKISEVSVTFQGVTALEVPWDIHLCIQTNAGTGSSLPLLIENRTNSDTIDASALDTYTGSGNEPTTTDILRRWYLHTQVGLPSWIPPSEDEPLRIGSGDRIAIRVISPSGAATTNVTGYLAFIE